MSLELASCLALCCLALCALVETGCRLLSGHKVPKVTKAKPAQQAPLGLVGLKASLEQQEHRDRMEKMEQQDLKDLREQVSLLYNSAQEYQPTIQIVSLNLVYALAELCSLSTGMEEIRGSLKSLQDSIDQLQAQCRVVSRSKRTAK